MDNYTLWTKHGEPGVPMEDNEENNDDDDNIPNWAHLYKTGVFEDEPMHEQKQMLQKNNNHLTDLVRF